MKKVCPSCDFVDPVEDGRGLACPRCGWIMVAPENHQSAKEEVDNYKLMFFRNKRKGGILMD